MKLKKALVFILCAVFALPLAACSKDGSGGGDVKPVDPNKEYKVTFDVGQEAAACGLKNPKTQTVMHGKTIAYLPSAAYNSDDNGGKYENHTLLGWFDGKEQLTRETKITRNWNVKARWQDDGAQEEEAQKYEANISSWDQPGHLYIHYKRAGHTEADQGKKYDGNGPEYDDPNKAIKSDVYGDWGLWLFPTNGPLDKDGNESYYSYEGVLFYPSKIDESGAVYDILLDHTYTKGGWDENTLTDKGLNVKYIVDQDGSVRNMSIQLFSIMSRKMDGFWKNDCGDVPVYPDNMKREKGSYHWFVSEGYVGNGSAKFTGSQVEDFYQGDSGDLPTAKYATPKSGDGIINSNKNNGSTYDINKVPVVDYSETGVGYQVFVASFRDGLQDDKYTPKGTGRGDLRGVIDAIDEDYFTKLNVDVLWLTPFQTSSNYHGYDIKDYYSVDPHFGTLADYRELVKKAHDKGIKVVMDFVLNHTAQGNPWFIKSTNLVKEEQPDGSVIDYRNFYNWITKAQYDSLHDCTPESKKADGHVCAKDQWFEDAHHYYFYSSFGSSMPELNYDYQPVRDAILDVCKYWMAFGLDGFRLDAVKHIYMNNEVKFDGNGAGEIIHEKDKPDDPYAYDMTRNMNFWREFNYKLKSHYPNAFLVGENLDGDPSHIAPFYAGMDSQFDFNGYYDATRALSQSDSAAYAQWSGVNKVHLKQRDGENGKGYSSYNSHYINGQFTSNHDLPRARDKVNAFANGSNDEYRSFFNDVGTNVIDKNGKPVTINGVQAKMYDDYKTNPTVTAITKERADRSDALLRLYYAYLLTTPGIAWIYNGDELGMTGNMNCMMKDAGGLAKNATAHEDRVYRQPMKWHDDLTKNASFDIGFNNYKCELVGLNTTQYVKGADVQDTDADSMLNWVRKLAEVRNDHPELINGKMEGTYQNSSGSVAKAEYVIKGASGSTRVIISTSGAVSAPAGKTTYASYTSGKYSVVICQG